MADIEELKAKIEKLKKEKQAVVLAHYYTRPEIQDVADHIGDSLALAQIGTKLTEPVVVMCGVHFMGETVKILCPDRRCCCLTRVPDVRLPTVARPVISVVSSVSIPAIRW